MYTDTIGSIGLYEYPKDRTKRNTKAPDDDGNIIKNTVVSYFLYQFFVCYCAASLPIYFAVHNIICIILRLILT